MLLINDLAIIATEIRLNYRIHWPSQAITAKKKLIKKYQIAVQKIYGVDFLYQHQALQSSYPCKMKSESRNMHFSFHLIRSFVGIRYTLFNRVAEVKAHNHDCH